MLIAVHVIPVGVSVHALPGPHGLPYGLLQNTVLVVAPTGAEAGGFIGAALTFFAAIGAKVGGAVGAALGFFVANGAEVGGRVKLLLRCVATIDVVLMVAGRRHLHWSNTTSNIPYVLHKVLHTPLSRQSPFTAYRVLV
jgi:hypothetical protein